MVGARPAGGSVEELAGLVLGCLVGGVDGVASGVVVVAPGAVRDVAVGEPDLAREPEVDQGEPEREVSVSVRVLGDVPVGVAGQAVADALLEGGALLALELGRGWQLIAATR